MRKERLFLLHVQHVRLQLLHGLLPVNVELALLLLEALFLQLVLVFCNLATLRCLAACKVQVLPVCFEAAPLGLPALFHRLLQQAQLLVVRVKMMTLRILRCSVSLERSMTLASLPMCIRTIAQIFFPPHFKHLDRPQFLHLRFVLRLIYFKALQDEVCKELFELVALLADAGCGAVGGILLVSLLGDQLEAIAERLFLQVYIDISHALRERVDEEVAGLYLALGLIVQKRCVRACLTYCFAHKKVRLWAEAKARFLRFRKDWGGRRLGEVRNLHLSRLSQVVEVDCVGHGCKWFAAEFWLFLRPHFAYSLLAHFCLRF